MKTIGITGGIASGKSTVARMFTSHGFDHFDADEVVHDLLREDRDTIVAVAAVFPQSLKRGQIGRHILSQIVVTDPSALATLESIIHPRVRLAEERAIEAARAGGKKGIILDIPLLFETGVEKLCDLVIAVHAPLEVARERAFERPGMTEEKWERLTRRQLNERDRCARADHVIPTEGTEEETRHHVEALVKKWGL